MLYFEIFPKPGKQTGIHGGDGDSDRTCADVPARPSAKGD